MICSPDEVAETQHEDTDSRELDHIVQVRIEFFDVIAKHGRQRQWPKALCESDHGRRCDAEHLPPLAPIQGIVRVL